MDFVNLLHDLFTEKKTQFLYKKLGFGLVDCVYVGVSMYMIWLILILR